MIHHELLYNIIFKLTHKYWQNFFIADPQKYVYIHVTFSKAKWNTKVG